MTPKAGDGSRRYGSHHPPRLNPPRRYYPWEYQKAGRIASPELSPNGGIRYDLKNPYPKLWSSQAGDLFNIYFYKRGNRGRLIIDGMILTILPCLNPTPPSHDSPHRYYP